MGHSLVLARTKRLCNLFANDLRQQLAHLRLHLSPDGGHLDLHLAAARRTARTALAPFASNGIAPNGATPPVERQRRDAEPLLDLGAGETFLLGGGEDLRFLRRRVRMPRSRLLVTPSSWLYMRRVSTRGTGRRDEIHFGYRLLALHLGHPDASLALPSVLYRQSVRLRGWSSQDTV